MVLYRINQRFLSHASLLACIALIGLIATGCTQPDTMSEAVVSTNNSSTATSLSQEPTTQEPRSSDPTTESVTQTSRETTPNALETEDNKMETATFGAGCFWCVEAVFQKLKGVEKVESGYMGGHVDNPTYKMICTGTTGHAEVIQIKYNPEVVSFDTLLAVFWQTHDPTTLNRQGNDVGTQYRSAVFYHNDEQRKKATEYKKKLNDENAFPGPIVTEITAVSKYYPAEDYHQNYFNENPNQPYCRMMIPPKLEKLKKVFGDKLK